MAFAFNIKPALSGKTLVIDPRGIIKNEEGMVTYRRDSVLVECGSWSYLVACSITRYTIPLNKIVIGKFCSIATNVKFIGANNHHYEWITSYPLELIINDNNNLKIHMSQPRNTSVGNDVWIGEGVTIMPGVHLSDGCVIGTNSLISKSTEPYGVYGGNPARLIKYRFSEDIIAKLIKIQWWNFNNSFIKKNTKLIFSAPTNETLDMLISYKLESDLYGEIMDEATNIVVSKII